MSWHSPSAFSLQESLIDASEDSQLEAAIRASLQETHYESSSAPDVPDSPRSDDESDAEPFSDSDGPISVDGSDGEASACHEEKSSSSKHLPLPLPSAPQPRLQPDSVSSTHKKSPYKENNHSHKKEESKKNHLEHPVPPARPSRSEADSSNHCTSSSESPGPSKIICSQTTSAECPDDNGRLWHVFRSSVTLWQPTHHPLTVRLRRVYNVNSGNT